MSKHGDAKIKCWLCGKDATISRAYGLKICDCYSITDFQEPSKNKRCYCESCFEKEQERLKQEQKQYVALKKSAMFENAMILLEKQKYDFYKNKDVIDAVHEKLVEEPDKFDSSYEIVAAIILVQNRIYSKMQYKVLRYQVDFLIPEYLVCLEIDGDRHKTRKKYDSKRDEQIVEHLGKAWNVIRIPTELIEQDATKIIKGIENVLIYRDTHHINWRNL